MDNYKNIDLSYLELMSDGDAGMKAILLDMLLTEPATEFEKMKQLAADQNWEDLKQVSHKMKSTLPYIGFEELSETNKKVDKMLWENKNTDLEESVIAETIPGLVSRVSELYEAALPELQDARNQLMNPA